ncbi:hypothetical protein FrEUN1fDRAFT_5845, partial [Parafrankia sp. EUN1f]
MPTSTITDTPRQPGGPLSHGPQVDDPMWGLLLATWDLSLESAGRAANTRRIYLHAGRLFVAWLLALPDEPGSDTVDAHGRPVLPRPAGPEDITRQHVEGFLVAFRTTPTPRCPNGPGQAYVNQI